MQKQKPPRPTDAELEILRVLWDRGECTVGQVHEVMEKVKPTRYTTVLKFLQIMLEKGLVTRDSTNRTHVYRATVSEQQTQRHIVRDVLERAFAGSAHKLVVQALSARKASPEELREIRRIIDQMEEQQG